MKTLLLLILLTFISGVIIAQENGGPYTADENTVLLIHFDGDANNLANVGNDPITHGTGVSYESGVHGQCLRLDNSTAEKQSWIEIPFFDELNFTEEFSIECWFKINSWGENQTEIPILFRKWFSGAADFEVVFNPGNRSFQVNLDCIDDENGSWGADAGTARIMELQKWYYLSVYYSYEQKHVNFVLRDSSFNEIFAARGYSETPPVNSQGKLMLGYGGWDSSFFDGWIDEFRVSNKCRKYRDNVLAGVDINAFKDSVFIPLKDNWKVGEWPLSEYYPTDKVTGQKYTNFCGPTMLMRTIHFWEFPRFPSGLLDYEMMNLDWFTDYNISEYNFDAILHSFPPNVKEEEYGPTARFSYEVGTASMNYFDNMYCMPVWLKQIFHFNKKTRVLFREEYTKEEWQNIFKNELNNGRPIMIGGVASRSSTGGGGHYYICNGYNSKNEFFTDHSFDDKIWVDIDNFPYGISQDIIVFLEPDLEGKSLSLDFPNGGEYFQKQSEIEIRWTSNKINNLKIEYSTDAGKIWQTITENADASTGKYNWTIPDLVSKEYKIRVSDSENGNVYQRSPNFNIYNQQTISFHYPVNNTYFQAGTMQPVYWDSEGIPAFKLEYSTGEGDWNLLCDSVTSASGILNCEMPEISNNQVFLRATNLTDNQVFFVSDTFRILPELLVGGVYKKNENTILLLHFEENVLNAAQNKVIPAEKSVAYNIFEENYNLNLGKAFRINNTADADWHCLRTPNTDELNLGNNWTVETWVKYNDIGTSKTQYPLIVDKGESFGIWLAGDRNGFGGYVKFNDQSEVGFFQNQHLEKNKWYHVAITSDSNTKKVKFYVHDEHRKLIFEDFRDFPSGNSGELNHSTNDLFIGGVDGGSNIQFDGWIDELRITKEPVNYSSMVTKVEYKSTTNEILCYPNPLSKHSVIQFSTEKNENVNLSIFDIQGRKICTLLNEKLNAGKHTIPISDLLPESGVYFCKLVTNEGISTIKLIKNK